MGNKFNFAEAREKAVRAADQQLEQGMEKIVDGEQEALQIPSVEPKPAEKPAEPTKGVQTYIAVSMYRRLSDIKLSRGETIGNLVAEAVALWLDVQEGKTKVSATI